MREIKEQQQRDKKDFTSKLATFKVEMGMMTFEKSTFNFLKDKVTTGWNDNLNNIKSHEARLDEYRRRHEKVIRRL